MLQIAALGGALALDATSVGQFMVSRPLVAGALTGVLLGAPVHGMVVGAILELYLLVAFPTGGSRFPEGATATVVAVGSSAGIALPGALPVAVAVGLIWGQIGGVSITWLRRFNGRIAPSGSATEQRAASISLGHMTSVSMDLVRGTLVTLTGLYVGRAAVGTFGSEWALGSDASMGLLLVGGAVSVGVLLRDFGGYRRHRVWLVAGLALGMLGARLL